MLEFSKSAILPATPPLGAILTRDWGVPAPDKPKFPEEIWPCF